MDASIALKPMKKVAKLYRTNFLFALGLTICLIWILAAIFAYQIIPRSPVSQEMASRFQSPNSTFLFGTDEFGRDIFSRVIVGSRLSILAGLVTVALASVIGSIYGGVAGYLGGLVDNVMMRFSEMVLSFPAIILAMTITAALGPSLFNTLLALVIVSWPTYARVMRSIVITVKENEYVLASKAIGTSTIRILTHEILPNSIGSVLVMATLDVGNAILNFSGLSFLGLGSPPPTPEWGAMVADGIQNFVYWWVTVFPGLAILTMAVGANFIGDGIRDYLDPKLRKEF
jgi:peptide/nickel transport system permease protein